MKREHSIIIAGGAGLLAALGIILLRRHFSNKAYNEYYQDFHRHFVKKSCYDDTHGVEYLALK